MGCRSLSFRQQLSLHFRRTTFRMCDQGRVSLPHFIKLLFNKMGHHSCTSSGWLSVLASPLITKIDHSFSRIGYVYGYAQNHLCIASLRSFLHSDVVYFPPQALYSCRENCCCIISRTHRYINHEGFELTISQLAAASYRTALQHRNR